MEAIRAFFIDHPTWIAGMLLAGMFAHKIYYDHKLKNKYKRKGEK